MRFGRLTVVVIVGLAIASCSLREKIPGPKLDEVIVGRWREINGSTTMEFFREGALIVANNKSAMSAYYEVVDEESIKVEPKFRSRAPRSDSRIWRVSIKGNQLTVVEGKTVTRFQRQR